MFLQSALIIEKHFNCRFIYYSRELSTIEAPGPLVRENSWDRLPTFNSVLVASNRCSGDYANSFDGINVLDDSYVVSPKPSSRKGTISSNRKLSTSRSRRSVESPRSEDSEEFLGEDDEVVEVEDLDNILKDGSFNIKSDSEELFVGFEPSSFEKPPVKKALSTVEEENDGGEDTEDEVQNKFFSNKDSTRPCSLERGMDKNRIQGTGHLSHSLDDIDTLMHTHPDYKQHPAFGPKHRSTGSIKKVDVHDRDNYVPILDIASNRDDMQSSTVPYQESPRSIPSTRSMHDIEEEYKSANDDPSPASSIIASNHSGTMELVTATESVTLALSRSKSIEDLSPVLSGSGKMDGVNLLIKTSGLTFDSPSNTVRVNTAEVYDAEDLFLESNPMHDDGETVPSVTASSSLDYSGSGKAIGKSPTRRASRSGTPTNVLRAQRESQTRTPQSILRSSSQGQLTMKPRDIKDEIEKYSPPKQVVSSKKSFSVGTLGSNNKENLQSSGDSVEIVESTSPPEVSSVLLESKTLSTVKSLNLAHKEIPELYLVEYLEPDVLFGLKVLVLRNIGLSSLAVLRLPRWVPGLTDLDLGNNKINGKLEEDSLPTKLLRLDLSYNQLTDVTAVMKCFELVHLDLSHNALKNLYGLPTKLERLNLSNNKLISVASLRSLTMCSSLQSIAILNNPMTSQIPNIRVFLMSLFRNLVEYDGIRFATPKPTVKIAGNPKKRENVTSTSSAEILASNPSSVGSQLHIVKDNANNRQISGSNKHKKAPKSNHTQTKFSISKKEQAINDQRRSDLYLEKQKALEKAKVERERKAIEALEGPKKKMVLKSDQVDRLTSRLAAPRPAKEVAPPTPAPTKSVPRPISRKSSAPAPPERSLSRSKDRPQTMSTSHAVYSNYAAKPKPSLLVSVLNTSSSSFRLQHVLKASDEVHIQQNPIQNQDGVNHIQTEPLPSETIVSSQHISEMKYAASTANILKGGRSTTPNSTNSLQCAKPESGKRSDSQEGLKLSDVNSKLPVIEYIDSLSLEVGRMAAAFKLIYMLFDKDSLVSDDLVVFNSSFERFLDSDLKVIPSTVLELLNGVDSLSYVEEKHKINLYHEHYDKIIQLFTQIQTVLTLSIQSGVKFYETIELIMNTKLGKYVNQNILAKYYCGFDGKSSCRSPSRNSTMVAVSQDKLQMADPSVSNTSDHAANSALSMAARTPTAESGDFIHKIREPIKENAPNVESILSMDSTTHMDQEALSQHVISIAEPTDGMHVQSQSDSIGNPLDRVRSRVVQKYLPTKLVNSLASSEKVPVSLRGGNKSSVRGGDNGLRGSFVDEKCPEKSNSASFESPIRKFGDKADSDSMPSAKESAQIESTNTDDLKQPEEKSPMSLKDRVKLFSKSSSINRSTSAFTKLEAGKPLGLQMDVSAAFSPKSMNSVNDGDIKTVKDLAVPPPQEISKVGISNSFDRNDEPQLALSRDGLWDKTRKSSLDDANICEVDQEADIRLKKMLSLTPIELDPNADFKKLNVVASHANPINQFKHELEVDEMEFGKLKQLKNSVSGLIKSFSASVDFNYPEGDPTKRLLPDSPEHQRFNAPASSSSQWSNGTNVSSAERLIADPTKANIASVDQEINAPTIPSLIEEPAAIAHENDLPSTVLIVPDCDDSSIGSSASSVLNAKERLKARLQKNRMVVEPKEDLL